MFTNAALTIFVLNIGSEGDTLGKCTKIALKVDLIVNTDLYFTTTIDLSSFINTGAKR